MRTMLGDTNQVVDAPRSPGTSRSRKVGRLPVGWAWFAGLVGPGIVAFGALVEPPPAHPDAPEPLIGTILATALFVAMGGAVLFGVQRRIAALSWAMAVGGLALGMVIACPLSGHHTHVGMWWAGELIVSAGALAIAAGARYSQTLHHH